MSPNDERHAEQVAPRVQRTAQLEAIDEFIDWADAEWGEPSDVDKAEAARIWACR